MYENGNLHVQVGEFILKNAYIKKNVSIYYLMNWKKKTIKAQIEKKIKIRMRINRDKNRNYQ